MIFVIAKNEPTCFLLLSEKDLKSMRGNRTLFVDQRATGGAKFNKVILSLHATDEEAMMVVSQGRDLYDIRQHEPAPGEVKCPGCGRLGASDSMLEDKCVYCWAAIAKKAV
jgi:hypothetical protein